MRASGRYFARVKMKGLYKVFEIFDVDAFMRSCHVDKERRDVGFRVLYLPDDVCENLEVV